MGHGGQRGGRREGPGHGLGGPCPLRRGASHGLPEAEQHQSGFPRLHPCQQGGAGRGGQGAGVGVAAGPAQAPVPPTEPWVLSPQMMQTNVPGVFAAGDAVTFPLAWRNNRKVNIPHWQMAHAQGMTSPVAGWGRGRWGAVPRSQLLPAPPPVVGLGSWVSLSRLCGGLSDQPPPGDGAS